MSGSVIVDYTVPPQRAVLRRTDCCSALLQLTYKVFMMQRTQDFFSQEDIQNFLCQKALLISHIRDPEICPTCRNAFMNLPAHSLTSSLSSSCEDITPTSSTLSLSYREF